MADLPYDAANGEDLYDGTLDFNSMDDAYDPASPSAFLFEARDHAQLRDFCEYVRQDTVIGNAKKIQGIAVDATTPTDGQVLQYDSGGGDWVPTDYQLTAQDYIDYTPQVTPPSETEGRLYFDDTKQNLVLFNDATGTAHDIGREVRAPRAVNNTGVAITNGQVVYISGASGSSPEVSLARADTFDTSRVIAMCTEASVADATSGEFTTFGCVGGLNTSAYSPGDKLYLSESTAGAFTGTAPDGEYFKCEIGTVITSDASDGKVFFSPFTPELAAEVTRNKGWPASNASESTLSFVDGTRTFTITPAVDEYHFYQEGTQYRKTSAESIIIADTTGSHFVYYDAGVLTEMVNPTTSQIDDLILNKVFVAYIYWNSTDAKAIIVAEERHKAQTMDGMTPKDHAYTHLHEGSRYVSGYTPANVGTGGSGNSNADAQFGIGSGALDDEDIRNLSDAIASTTGLRYYYRSGASGDWTYGTNAGYSFPVGATPLPQYNQNTGSTWQLTEASSGYFILLHVFGLNSIDTSINAGCVLGQSQYATIGAAQTAAEDDIYNFSRGESFPFQEFIPVATFILECKTSFTNTPQARLVLTGDGGQYVDFRSATAGAGVGGGGTVTPPGGSDSQVQYNNGGSFGGSSAFTFDDLTDTLSVTNFTCGGLSVFSNATITGGTIDGPSIGSTTEATIDHDALANYVADEHVAHSGVNITGGEGLTGGGAITISRTLDLDVNGLTAETVVDDATDYLVMYDTSAGAHRKVLVENVVTASAGDVIGPASSVDSEFLIADGITGKALKQSGIILGQQGDFKVIRPNTLDASDDESIAIAGGGSLGETRGGEIRLCGNEASLFEGDVEISSGQVTNGGDITIYAKGLGTGGNATLRAEAGEVKFISGTSDGSTGFSFINGSLAEVASVRSNGDATFANLPAPNLLINADGTNPLDQRGSLPATDIATGTYTADRWKTNHDGGGSDQIDVTVETDGGLRVTATARVATTYLDIFQFLEDYAKYQGVEITLSASVRSNIAGTQLRAYDGVSTYSGDSHSGGGTFETLALTFTPLAGRASLALEVIATTVTASGDYIEFEWIKLEVGSVATPFVADLPGVNLAKCQRYFCSFGPTSAANESFAAGYNASSTLAAVNIQSPVTMRTQPTLSVSATSDFGVYSTAGNTAATGISLASWDTDRGQVNITVAGGLTAGEGCLGESVQTGATLYLDAEL